MKTRNILLSILFVLSCDFAVAQFVSVKEMHEQRIQFANNSMYVLGSWALLNIGSGALLQKNANGANKYFHQGNAYWNLVNLGLAGFSLYANSRADVPPNASVLFQNENQFQRILLFNAGLDLGYMATGWALTERGRRFSGKKLDQFKGFGKSLIVQGAFLLIFDSTLYLLRNKENGKILEMIGNGQ